MSSTFANGWFPLGHNWPFQREVRRVDVSSADYSDNEDDEGASDQDVLQETRQMSWNTILQQVEDDIPACTGAILELSNPNIFMLLTFDVELLNDLFFLDYLTDSDNAFNYMANTLQQLAKKGPQQTTAPHMELPFNRHLLVYWKNLLSRVDDGFVSQSCFTFFRYHKDKNSYYGVPTRTLQIFDLCLPLHFIFYLLQDARSEPCPQSSPFGRRFKTRIPEYLVDYMRPRFQQVEREIVYNVTNANYTWMFNDKPLNDKMVVQITKLARYGIGNAYKKEAWIDRSGGYQYQAGEKPWVCIENEDEHVEDVLEHEWRVHYISPEFLRSKFEKTMGTETFTEEDKDHFVSRQMCNHPADYHIPRLILNHPMEPPEGKKFKTAWKSPENLAQMHDKKRNPWAQNIKSCLAYNKEVGRSRPGRKRKR